MYMDWMPSLAIVFIIILMYAVKSAKKRITIPRMLYIELTPSPKAGRRKSLFVVLIAGLVFFLFLAGLLFFARAELVAWISERAAFLWGFIGILVVGLLGLAGWATGARRLLIYPALAVVVWLVTLWLGVDFLVLLTALGAVILVTGIVILAQFLRKYPVHPA